MSADDISETNRFNVLQFAHQILYFVYHGSQCSRLEQFTTCWNLLQETCSAKVRGFALHANLLVVGCKIQNQMDAAGCHWQDMLLGHYIRASQLTAWPLGGQATASLMYLEHTASYKANITEDLDRLIDILRPGAKEVSQRCGIQIGKLLKSFLSKLQYLQRNAFNKSVSVSENIRLKMMK